MRGHPGEIVIRDESHLHRMTPGGLATVDSAMSPATRQRLADSIAPNTVRAYSRVWDGRTHPDAPAPIPPGGFLGWCMAAGRSPLPATPETLAEYVSHLCDEGKSPATIEQAIAAVRTIHHMAGQERPDAEKALRVLKAHRRFRADAGLGNQRQSLPVVVDGLRKMVDTLDRSTPIGLRDHALLLLGIVSFGRRSEIVSYTWEDVSKAPEGLVLRLRRSKTDQEARGAAIPVLYGAFPGTDPVRVIARWRELCEARGITSGPLLRSVDRHGRVGAGLSAQAVNDVVQRCADRAGLGDGFTAHSLRAGAATIAYMNGAPISSICRLGRWKQGSPVVLGYIRSVDQWKDHPFRGVL